MVNTEYALNLFDQGYNCSQAVFVAASRDEAVDEVLARKISLPFGGGIARNGQTCGAVTGALMMLGIRYGVPETSPEIKKSMYERCNDFIDEFKKRHGSVMCKDLIGCDLSTEEGRKIAAERKVHMGICRDFISTAMEILAEK